MPWAVGERLSETDEDGARSLDWGGVSQEPRKKKELDLLLHVGWCFDGWDLATA